MFVNNGVGLSPLNDKSDRCSPIRYFVQYNFLTLDYGLNHGLGLILKIQTQITDTVKEGK